MIKKTKVCSENKPPKKEYEKQPRFTPLKQGKNLT